MIIGYLQFSYPNLQIKLKINEQALCSNRALCLHTVFPRESCGYSKTFALNETLTRPLAQTTGVRVVSSAARTGRASNTGSGVTAGQTARSTRATNSTVVSRCPKLNDVTAGVTL